MRHRHVVILIQNLPVPVDRRVWQEAHALTAAGWDVTVICPEGKGWSAGHQRLDEVDVYWHPAPPEAPSFSGYIREYAFSLRHLRRLLKTVWNKKRFDAIHLCNPPDVLFMLALPYKALHGVKVVFDHHDVNPELYEAKFNKRGLPHRALLLAERATFAVADRSIATNESYKKVAIERGHMPKERVHVVRSAPDWNELPETTAAVNESGDILVGYVGVMGEQDGIDYLLKAAHSLKERGRHDIRFRLIGDGPARADSERLSAELGLEQSVEFCGVLTGQKLIDALSQCVMGVGPDPKDTYSDKCTMNKTLEYMALGLPSVMFDLTEGRASAGDAALYAAANDPDALADGIVKLADDAELRRQLGEEGKRRMAGPLGWRTQAEELVRCYEALMPHSDGRR